MNNTNFAFRCFFQLKKNLGRFDAVVECNELAVRQFVDLLNKNNDQEKYILGLSEQYGVKVNTIDPNIFSHRISQWYILSVYQQAEEFFTAFRKEHPQSHQWTERKKGEFELEYLLRMLNLKPNDIDSKCKGIRFIIFDYYRLIRNRFMHTDAKDSNLKQSLNHIKNHEISILEEFHLNAPNEYKFLTFDDFILFSRVTKDIAKELCRLSKPNDSDIIKMLLKREEEGDSEINLKRLKLFSNNKERLRKSLNNLLRVQYNLQEHEVKTIMEELTLSGLLAQW